MVEEIPFDPGCLGCPRLVDFLQQVRSRYPDYHAAPVAPFGVDNPTLLIVGLAPGMHGANRTGRPFTGDYAGILLYETLFQFGFSNQPQSQAVGDALQLRRCRITNAVKCLPPDNKPTPDEVRRCNGFLQRELQLLPVGTVILALGAIAHGAVVRALAGRLRDFPFGHGQEHRIAGHHLLDSYHCSRYNTQTRRLTPEMFHAVFQRARAIMAS